MAIFLASIEGDLTTLCPLRRRFAFARPIVGTPARAAPQVLEIAVGPGGAPPSDSEPVHEESTGSMHTAEQLPSSNIPDTRFDARIDQHLRATKSKVCS